MRRPKWYEATALGAVAALVLLLLLVFVAYPPPPNGETRIGSRLYYVENETLFGRTGPTFGPAYSNYAFHGVRFVFHWSAAAGYGPGPCVCGNATESDGASYSFGFAGGSVSRSSGPPAWQTWIAPDGLEAVQFEPDSGFPVNLLVAV
jgi:hypothetical protein